MSFTEQITWHDPKDLQPDDGIDVLVLNTVRINSRLDRPHV